MYDIYIYVMYMCKYTTGYIGYTVLCMVMYNIVLHIWFYLYVLYIYMPGKICRDSTWLCVSKLDVVPNEPLFGLGKPCSIEALVGGKWRRINRYIISNPDRRKHIWRTRANFVTNMYIELSSIIEIPHLHETLSFLSSGVQVEEEPAS